MQQSHREKSSNWGGPGTYRIRVRGSLDDKWSDRVGGMVITRDSPPDQDVITTLVGRLRDQAALSGVLTTLYELHLAILSVETLSGEE
jgi:hypothetical protein